MDKLKYSLLPLALAVSNAVMADDDAELKSIEQIVVYGENKQNSLKNTTSSIAVIDEEQLKNGQHSSYLNALQGIANVIVTGGLPSIRGQEGQGVADGFSSFSSGAKPRISMMRDGVAEPFVAKVSGDLGLWDVEQIEVLRGPQSSNSGRNSIGGVVYIKTKEPSLTDLEAATRIGYANQDSQYEYAGVVSVPLIEDQLAVRTSVQHIEGETYLNFVYDKGYPFDPKEYDNTRTDIKVKWQPAGLSGLDMLLHYVDNSEMGERQWGFEGPDLDEHLVTSEYGRDPATGERVFVGTYARDKRTDYERWSLRTRYTINDAFNFELMISDSDYDYVFEQYPTYWHVSMADGGRTYDAKVSYDGGERVSGYVGYYYNERDQQFIRQGWYDGYDDSDSKAIYGEFTFAVGERSRLITGGRVEEESQYRVFNGFGGPVTGLGFTLDVDNRIYLPKVAFLHDLTEDTTLNASFRKGYSSGGGDFHWGSMSNYIFKPEYVDTFELGARSSVLDGRLNLAANVFYNDFTDYQFNGIAESGLARDYKIINLGQVTSYGLETEARFSVNDELTLSASLGLLNSTIDEANAQNRASEGMDLPKAADVTLGLGLEYWPTDSIQLTARSNFVGDYYSKLGGKAEQMVGDYTQFHFSAAYIAEQWRVNAYINNAFDEKGVIYGERDAGTGRYKYGDLIDPQTVGISFNYTL
ncbi:TonB-dependent receptor [Pseudoalteromonas viridis]|uniref:TonB-dependent receptor n=1 Tax=Pseudoalteromonas viridis TaxID=339617 RepID=A0ABX7VCK6_9GAMM|nr:TonB-dependent receptor [Pseudoalteromonas viridis]QTL36259.1 TonB-dependent receptor [Pseudoalteromonas viridis]